jgi:hypothetical protein
MARPTSRVSRVLMTGPLAPFADAYREELLERGYADATRGVSGSPVCHPQRPVRPQADADLMSG